jgi:ribosomal protein S18 acetylase RimI-like enzyme
MESLGPNEHEVVAEDIIIRRLGPQDDLLVMQAADLFDNPPAHEWVTKFLRARTHHILIAYRSGRPLGFVTAVEMTHPDKGAEMFVYEMSVAPEDRRQGVAKALVSDLTALAKEQGCYDMWVLADQDNVAALSLYESTGATRDGEPVMLTWDWG